MNIKDEFREFLNETTLEPKKNWKDIVQSFDKIEDIIIQPNGKSLRVRGKVKGKFADMYVDYNNKEVAQEVYNKIKSSL